LGSTGAEEKEVEAFKEQMKVFNMSGLGLLCFNLGVDVRHDASGITFHQTHYTKRILELGGMDGCNTAYTPMEEHVTTLLKKSADLAFTGRFVSWLMEWPMWSTSRLSSASFATLWAPSTTVCTTQGPLARRTLSAMAIAISAATSTQA
jgi:hypothetical protein